MFSPLLDAHFTWALFNSAVLVHLAQLPALQPHDELSLLSNLFSVRFIPRLCTQPLSASSYNLLAQVSSSFFYPFLKLWFISKVERTVPFLTLYVRNWYPCPLAQQQKTSTVKHSRANVANTALMYNAACFPSTGGDREIPEVMVCLCLRER